MSDKRTTEIWEEFPHQGPAWKEVSFQDLKKGDKFRLFEPDGEPVVGDEEGKAIFICVGDAYQNQSTPAKVWTVDIETE